jgi:hypothetical protein
MAGYNFQLQMSRLGTAEFYEVPLDNVFHFSRGHENENDFDAEGDELIFSIEL